jgi:hypothetical protein
VYRGSEETASEKDRIKYHEKDHFYYYWILPGAGYGWHFDGSDTRRSGRTRCEFRIEHEHGDDWHQKGEKAQEGQHDHAFDDPQRTRKVNRKAKVFRWTAQALPHVEPAPFCICTVAFGYQ